MSGILAKWLMHSTPFMVRRRVPLSSIDNNSYIMMTTLAHGCILSHKRDANNYEEVDSTWLDSGVISQVKLWRFFYICLVLFLTGYRRHTKHWQTFTTSPLILSLMVMMAFYNRVISNQWSMINGIQCYLDNLFLNSINRNVSIFYLDRQRF